MPNKDKTIQSQRAQAYDWALRVLSKRYNEEFKAIYARILKEEFGLDTSSTPSKQLSKYVQETKMSLLKELQDINKWLDEIIWEVNKFNETLDDLAAKYGQRTEVTQSQERVG